MDQPLIEGGGPAGVGAVRLTDPDGYVVMIAQIEPSDAS